MRHQSALKFTNRFANIINFVFKLGILGLSIVYIFLQLSNQSAEHDVWGTIVQELGQWHKLPYLILLIILLFCNWALEALKWQQVASRVEKISFLQAFSAVLTGLVMAAFSFQTVGHHFGRVWQLNSRSRYRLLGGSVLSNITQMYFTYLFGWIGFWLIFEVFDLSLSPTFYYLLMIGGSLLLFAGPILLVLVSLWIGPLLKLSRFVRYYFAVIEQCSPAFNIRLLVLSLLRYAVFSFQFYIILYLFGIMLPMAEQFAIVSLVFLVKSSVPNFNILSNLGVREASSMYLFGLYQVSQPMVFSASFALWMLNILLPTLIGLFLIPRMNINKK